MNQVLMLESTVQRFYSELMAFYGAHKKSIFLMTVVALATLLSLDVMAATATDTWAISGYNFILAAAQGNFVRAVCIVGGLLGLIMGAGSGKPILALTGVVLGMFGVVSPTMINAIFGSAVI